MKTTTDVLNKASHIMTLARVVNGKQRKERLEVERKDVLRIATSALETGGFEGQARQELKGAQHLLTVGFKEAVKQNRANEMQASFKALLKN